MKNGNRVKIAIVNSSSFGRVFPEHLKELKEFGDVNRFDFPTDISGKELAERLKGYKIIVASVMPYYNREFFEHNGDVVLISRHGIGVNNVDIGAATEKGVLVTRVRGDVEQEAMAEHTVTLLLAVLRRIIPAFDDVRRGRWKNRAHYIGMELRGRTVGIVGIGNIGSRVAEILRKGFGAKVIAYDPYLTSEEICNRNAIPLGFKELLDSSDIISLHAPLTDETFHMIGAKEFSMMKDGVILVDTARGELIDTGAMLDALRSGKLAGVGMDVIEGEPIGAEHPILGFENVVIAPHIGAYTEECLRGMGEKVVDDIRKLLSGKIPDMLVNPEVLKRGNRWNESGAGG